MADTLRLIRIFIGSPGGLEAERQAAHEVVNSVNRSHSERWGLHFKLFGWEDAVPGYVRPQSKINNDLDKCAYFIGVLWNHWGSKPHQEHDGPSSGFEEEYCRAEDRIQRRLMCDMALYFKTVEIPPGMEPGESIKRVLDFKKKCTEEKKVFYKEFSDVHSFKDAVREKLEEIGWRETTVQSADNSPVQPERNLTNPESPADPNEGRLLDESARTFLSGLIAPSSSWESTLPQDIARLRLIATAVSLSGNDALYLGAHDANLFFQYFRHQAISPQEIKALIDCGVNGYEHQNVPLWHWLSKTGIENHYRRISILAVVGTDSERTNAIELLRISSQNAPDLDDFITKSYALSTWLADGTPQQVFDAAVNFIAANLSYADLSLIEEVSACSGARRARLNEAIVAITAKHSVDAALKTLMEKDVETLDDTLADRLFAHPDLLSTKTLSSCLTARPDRVRLNALKILSRRREAHLEIARSLLTDSNYEIRLLAAEILRSLGVQLSDEVVMAALKITRSRNNALMAFFDSSETDDTYYNRYLINRLAELDFSALSKLVDDAGVFDQREIIALYSNYPSKTASSIRSNLQDGFKSHFEMKIRKGLDEGSVNSDLELRIRKLEKFLCGQVSISALSALCTLNSPDDIHLVRSVIDNNDVEATTKIIDYIGRCGEWEDISRICKLYSGPTYPGHLFESTRDDLVMEKARAVFAIGRGRIVDLLDEDLPDRIRICIARLVPRITFLDLGDDILLRHLDSENVEFRAIFALRCVEVLPKRRLESLLEMYIKRDARRFYNSVHWLDLGASFPARASKQIARRVIDSRF